MEGLLESGIGEMQALTEMAASFHVFVLPFPLLVRKLCYDTSLNRRPIVNECIRRYGKSSLAWPCLIVAVVSSHASARAVSPFHLSGSGNRTGWILIPSPFIVLFFPCLVSPCFPHLVGSKLEGAVCLSVKDVVGSPHLLGCHVALLPTPMTLLARDHQGRATNPSVCVTSPSLCSSLSVRYIDQ